ncbi:MAG TPA: hypothetical protein VHM92_04635 [Allosphingosinicella sp.]|nr:hypothetical protein [Allosphingosinicella sp.]
MNQEAVTSPRSKPLFWGLLAGTVFYLLALLPAGMLAMMSPMASDSGFSTSIWIFIIAAMSLPIALVVCPWLGWIAYALRWNRTGWILLFLPCLWPLALIGAMA